MKDICKWAKTEIEIKYHNEEWCRICHDERKLFEMLYLVMAATVGEDLL